MKIGFDIEIILDGNGGITSKESKQILHNLKIGKLIEDRLSILNQLMKEKHDIYLFCLVSCEFESRDKILIKKTITGKLHNHRLGSVKVAVVNSKDLQDIAKRNYIDIFVLADGNYTEKVSKVTDAVCFNMQTTSTEMFESIQDLIVLNRKPMLKKENDINGLPSEDRQWMKYYRQGDFKWVSFRMSPYDRVVYSNQDWLDETAMEFFGKRFTYEQFFIAIDDLADHLLQWGIQKGIKVPIIVANTPEAVIVLYALYKVKATIVPIFPLLTVEDMGEKLADIDRDNTSNGARTLLFASDLVCGKFEQVIPKSFQVIVLPVSNSMPKLLGVAFDKIIMPKLGVKRVKLGAQLISYKEFMRLKLDRSKLTHIETGFDDTYPAIQLYTGGTIYSKGVMLSEANIDAASKQFYNDRFDFRRGDKIAAFMPLNHSFGLIIGTHVAITLGVNLDIIMKINFKRLDKVFLKEKCNLFGGIPNMFPAIRNNKWLENADLSHVKYVLSGGSRIDETEKQEITRFFREHQSSAELHDGYGATESAGGIIYDGIPNMNTNVKVVEPGTVKELGYEKIGELCLSGPQIMMGYTNHELTQHVLKEHYDGQIWLHTGDSARIHQNGKVEIIGRLDRMIKVNGEQVYLDKLEEEINRLPFVEKSVVVKKADPKRGYVPIAYLKLKPNLLWNEKLEEEVNGFYESKLTAFSRPRKTLVLMDLPVTNVGKIDFKELEKMANSQ